MLKVYQYFYKYGYIDMDYYMNALLARFSKCLNWYMVGGWASETLTTLLHLFLECYLLLRC